MNDLVNSFLVVATAAARPHIDNDLDLAKVVTASALAFISAGWKLPGLLAATPEMAESLRVNSDGKIYCCDENGQARYGRNGLMTAEERALELAANPKLKDPFLKH